MKLSEIYDEFILDKQIEGLSQKTIINYNDFVRDGFLDYLKINNIDELKIIDVKNYIRYLQCKKSKRGIELSTTTVQTYVRHIRAFLNYLYTKRYTDINWLLEIKLPRAFRSTIEILTDDEIMLMFAPFKNAKSEYKLRNRAILCLFLDTGIRADELCKIKISDINFTNNYIKITGKGSKERFIKFNLISKKFIYAYLHKRPMPDNENHKDYLFLTSCRYPITYNALRTMVHRLKNNIDIPRLHIHLFRHTYATRGILVDSMDLFSLQISLGHSDLTMTRKYSHIASEYLVIGIKPKPLAYLLF